MNSIEKKIINFEEFRTIKVKNMVFGSASILVEGIDIRKDRKNVLQKRNAPSEN